MQKIFSRSFILLTTALLAVSAFFVPIAANAASDGAGTMTVSPTTVSFGSSNNDFIFHFTNNSSNFGNGSILTLSVPLGWTNPQESNSGNAGYVTISSSTCTPDLGTGTGDISESGNVITVDINDCNTGDTFDLQYNNLTTPAIGSYTFTTRTQEGGSGLTAITVSPVINVNDTTPPVIALHANETATATASGGAVITYALPTTSDNVDAPGVATCLPASGSFFAIGTTTVTCNATDAAGNPATPTTFTVTVNPDVVNAGQSTVVTSTDEANLNSYVIVTVTAKDQFGNPIPSIAPADVVIAVSGGGNTIVQPTVATDSNGQTTGSFTSTIQGSKIVSVTILGTLLSAQPQVDFAAGNPANALITASINPAEASLTGTPLTLDIYITDSNGNPVNDNIAIDVTASTTAPQGTPVISGSGNTVAGHVTRTLTFDYKGAVNIAVSAFSGALSTSGDDPVNFTDTTLPVVNTNENISGIEATSPAGAVVNYENPIATDNIDGTLLVSCAPASGSTFPLGNTTVACTATDGSDNTGISIFTIEVVDTTKPEITAPEDITTEATATLTPVALGSPIVTDIADPSPVVTNDAPAGGFPVGDTTVTWTATDASGNSATDEQTVTIEDTTPPSIMPPATQTFEATGPTTTPVLVQATATDIADPSPVIIYEPYDFPLGTTTVTWTATDASGNSSTGTSDVIIQDTTGPEIASHENITAEATSSAGAVVEYENPGATDLVDGATEVSCAPSSGSTFALGDTIITCNSTDSHGNSATPTTFTITVQDTTGPEIVSHEDITAEGTSPAGANVTFTDPTAVDLVDGATSVACSPVSGSLFAMGDTTVTCTSTDSLGNTSSSTFTVHVVDTTPPTINNTPSDFTIADDQLGGAIVTYAMPDATDLVDVTDPVTCTPASGSFIFLGQTTVTCTSQDSAGNQATPTSFVVTVDPKPITHIIIEASPTSLKFGETSVITVTGKNEYENTIDETGTTVVLSADNGGALDYTILTLVNGVATANLTKDSVGIVHVTATSEGLSPVSVTVEFTEADTSAPYVQSASPATTGVPVNVQPYLIFSEQLEPSTVTSSTVYLQKAGGSAISATVSLDFMEGKQRATITPANPLEYNTQYYFVVTAGVTDLAGNNATPTETEYSFATAPDTTVLKVTGISAIKTYAIADNTYEHGWSWTFAITVPTIEIELQMKFADWTTTLPDTIPVANNVQYSSLQASNGPMAITAANTFAGALHLTGDLDSSAPGRQVEILVEAKIPEGSAGGSYTTSYGVQTNPEAI